MCLGLFPGLTAGQGILNFVKGMAEKKKKKIEIKQKANILVTQIS